MSYNTNAASRREFLKSTGRIAGASAFVGATIPHVHAAGTEDNTIRVALIGCGGRGTGAAQNALSSKNGPVKLVAMADVFDYRLNASYNALKKKNADKVAVPGDQRFIGFDGYKKAMDCLRPGDVAIFTTPPAFRWSQFGYAIEKNLNVFMEKPVTVDGPTTRKMLALAEQSVKKNLKVGVGLMCRHCQARGELHDRIGAGEIGEILELRAYRMTGPTASETVQPKPDNISELFYQIKNFHGFLWASGGCFSDYLIHNIDECCWMKNAWPVKADASGGRHYRGDAIDQNFDHYTVEYTFEDGSKLYLRGRTIIGCSNQFASYAHGTKGVAVISTSSHSPAKSRIYQGLNLSKDKLAWSYPKPERSPYRLEWDNLLNAIRKDTPYNEVKRGAEASLVASMGRLASHTGQIITYDQMLKHNHEFAPDVYKLTMDSPAPLLADADGKYPIPMPGFKKRREY